MKNPYAMTQSELVSEVLKSRKEIDRLKGINPGFNGNSKQRYGLRWNGPDKPLCVPMDDGYWMPWHLAQEEIKKARIEGAQSYNFELRAASKSIFAPHFDGVLAVWENKAKRGEV